MVNDTEIYRHYGSDHFNKDFFIPIKNNGGWNKPIGGLWGSPTKDVDFGWDSWCKENNFKVESLKKHFDFKLKEGARIYKVEKVLDINNMPRQKPDFFSEPTPIFGRYIDFEEIVKDYDAIQVWMYREPVDITDRLKMYDSVYYALYGWDCDCILILNKDIVEEVNYE